LDAGIFARDDDRAVRAFLATVPLSAARNSFDNLVIQAIDPTETPVSEWIFVKELSAHRKSRNCAQHIHEDTGYIVEAQWDFVTFETETMRWIQGPHPLEIICRGPQYDDGGAASDGQFSVDLGFEHLSPDTREFWPGARPIHSTARITHWRELSGSGCRWKRTARICRKDAENINSCLAGLSR